MCAPSNRKGVKCGECIEDFGISVISYGYYCSNCTGAWYGVPLYLFLEFVPITVFYLIILLLKINVTSAPMVAFVFYSQIAVLAYIQSPQNTFLFERGISYYFFSLVITLYGVWNLDFFRYRLPPFCVTSKVKTVHAIFLNYVSAFYPLCLIAITWICIDLHSRNVKPVVWMWKKLSKYHKINLDGKKSVIDVFATFFLLSYAKLAFTSVRLLSYGNTVNVKNFSESTQHHFLHVDSEPSIRYFSREHLPFAMFSILVFIVAIFPLTLLLILYPIKAFRSLIFKCHLGNRLIVSLNIFVDKFYSCYRDGLDGGRDMRLSLIHI